MNFESKYIKNIIVANNDKSLAIFVGSGISKSSETKSLKLPSWSDLIKDLKKDLNEDYENDYLKIAQLYYLAFGEFIYFKKLKEYFPEFIHPSIIHKIIFEINPHIIITTNWDNILERAIEENAYIFDTICSDNDLVKSSLPNKLIKMHGDFKNHNIVFKEDDYINYQQNFPLIENFVKSILSTHTVLFLGYSYNDINLKQILKWIQNHSNVRPPMYLTIFDHNPTQNKYLENHGIKTIVLNDIVVNDFDIGLDDYSKKMYKFLKKIKNPEKSNILLSENEVIEFVLNKLKYLNELDGILIEQVQKVLTNCGYVFDIDSLPILEFYKKILTTDIDKDKRDIYKQFIQIIIKIDENNNPTPHTIKIFEILNKARIKGIVISEDDISRGTKKYLPISNYLTPNKKDVIKTYFEFDFKESIKSTSEVSELFELAYKYYNLEKLDEAYSFIDEAISICLKERLYTWLFIGMFNRNVLLRKLKYGFNSNRDRYNDIEEYSLKDRYYNLPKDLQIALEPIYEFIDFSFIYKYAYKIAEELKKIKKSKDTIESGGFVFNSDIYQFSSKHENLVSFVLRNKIMIEDSAEFKNINKSFVQIAIIRQIQEENISLNKIELYACIKYFDHKELKELLVDYYAYVSNKKGKFQLSKDNKEWLIFTVFENIANQHIDKKRFLDYFERYMVNTLFILSLSEHQKKEVEKIMSIISMIVSEGNNSINIIQSINLFLGIQFNLYNLKIEEKTILKLIESLIIKLVSKQYNGHEYHALTQNEFSYLYNYAKKRKAVLKNKDLIDKLIKEIKEYSISQQIQITQNFVLSLYDISNKILKENIKSFILAINSSEEKDSYKKIVFDLALIIYKLKPLQKSNIQELDNYLSQYKDGHLFSSGLYLIDGQVNYLIKTMKVKDLDDVSTKIKAAIKTHEARKTISIF